METLQFIQLSPENYLEKIKAGIREELEELKNNYQPKEPEEYLSRTEVSGMLKIDITTVDKWSKTGKIIRYCLGNRVYFKRSEIEKSLTRI